MPASCIGIPVLVLKNPPSRAVPCAEIISGASLAPLQHLKLGIGRFDDGCSGRFGEVENFLHFNFGASDAIAELKWP
jgi:hypothetical protein